MKEREKLLLSAGILLLSTILLSFLVMNMMSASDIRLKSFGNMAMSLFKANEYKKLYDAFTPNYGRTLNQFADRGRYINEVAGNMLDFKVKDLKQRNQYIELTYDVTFSKYSNDQSEIIWEVIRDGKAWRMAGYHVKVNPLLTLSDNWKERNLSVSEWNNLEKVTAFGDQILGFFQSGNYTKIYGKGNEQFHSMGSNEDFSNYLSSIKKDYGQVKFMEFADFELGKNGKEIKLNYTMQFDGKRKLFLNVWVMLEGKGYQLSGLKFVENRW